MIRSPVDKPRTFSSDQIIFNTSRCIDSLTTEGTSLSKDSSVTCSKLALIIKISFLFNPKQYFLTILVEIASTNFNLDFKFRES